MGVFNEHVLEIFEPLPQQNPQIPGLEAVARRLFDLLSMRYQMKYDSVHGKFKHDVKIGGADELIVNGNLVLFKVFFFWAFLKVTF